MRRRSGWPGILVVSSQFCLFALVVTSCRGHSPTHTPATSTGDMTSVSTDTSSSSASSQTRTPETTHAPGTVFVNGPLVTSIAQTSIALTASPTVTPTPGAVYRSGAAPHGFIALSSHSTIAVDISAGDVSLLLTAPSTGAAYIPRYTFFPSPDGLRIAFGCDGTGLPSEHERSHLCIVSESGAAPPPVVAPSDLAVAGEVSPEAWSPDGRSLLFRVDPKASSGSADTYLLDVATSKAKRLVQGLRLSEPQWAPDGTRFAATTSVSLYVVDAASGNVTDLRVPIPDSESGITVQSFAWSPAGSEIAVTVGESGHLIWHLYVVAADGSTARNVGIGGKGIAWSPDGQWIVRSIEQYSAGSSPAPCNFPCPLLYAVRSDGSEDRALTDGFAVAVAATWSPDGERIAFRGATDSSGHTRLSSRASIVRRPSSRAGTSTPTCPTRISPGARAGTSSFIWVIRRTVARNATKAGAVTAISSWWMPPVRARRARSPSEPYRQRSSDSHRRRRCESHCLRTANDHVGRAASLNLFTMAGSRWSKKLLVFVSSVAMASMSPSSARSRRRRSSRPCAPCAPTWGSRRRRAASASAG